eukprot:93817_1
MMRKQMNFVQASEQGIAASVKSKHRHRKRDQDTKVNQNKKRGRNSRKTKTTESSISSESASPSPPRKKQKKKNKPLDVNSYEIISTLDHTQLNKGDKLQISYHNRTIYPALVTDDQWGLDTINGIDIQRRITLQWIDDGKPLTGQWIVTMKEEIHGFAYLEWNFQSRTYLKQRNKRVHESNDLVADNSTPPKHIKHDKLISNLEHSVLQLSNHYTKHCEDMDDLIWTIETSQSLQQMKSNKRLISADKIKSITTDISKRLNAIKIHSTITDINVTETKKNLLALKTHRMCLLCKHSIAKKDFNAHSRICAPKNNHVLLTCSDCQGMFTEEALQRHKLHYCNTKKRMKLNIKCLKKDCNGNLILGSARRITTNNSINCLWKRHKELTDKMDTAYVIRCDGSKKPDKDNNSRKVKKCGMVKPLLSFVASNPTYKKSLSKYM